MIPTKYLIKIDNIKIQIFDIKKITASLHKSIIHEDITSASYFSGLLIIFDIELFWEFVLCNCTDIAILYHLYKKYVLFYSKKQEKYDYNNQEFRNMQAELIGLLCMQQSITKSKNQYCKQNQSPIISEINEMKRVMYAYYSHKKKDYSVLNDNHPSALNIYAIPEIIKGILNINNIYLKINSYLE